MHLKTTFRCISFFLVFKEPCCLICQHPWPSRISQRYDIFLYRTNVFTAFLLSFVLKFFTHHWPLTTEIKVLLKTSNFAIKNVTLCPYSKMYLLWLPTTPKLLVKGLPMMMCSWCHITRKYSPERSLYSPILVEIYR